MAAAGWHVEAAADGAEALLVAPSFDPDAIIVDLQLPHVGGVALARALRRSKRLRGVRLVACSAYAHLLGDGTVRTDFDALVAKPCDPEALRRIVEELVGTLPGSPGS
jgi:CheY-like chemotaxis protein